MSDRSKEEIRKSNVIIKYGAITIEAESLDKIIIPSSNKGPIPNISRGIYVTSVAVKIFGYWVLSSHFPPVGVAVPPTGNYGTTHRP